MIDKRSKKKGTLKEKIRWERLVTVSVVAIALGAMGWAGLSEGPSLQKPQLKGMMAVDAHLSIGIPPQLDWRLRLVNEANPLPVDFTVETKKLSNGKAFDSRAIGDLQAMLSQAGADGIPLVVASAHRTMDYQVMLINKKTNYYVGQGYGQEEAYNIAKTIVAVPGTSEHNLGLAADIVSTTYQTLDSGFDQTEAFAWLSEHAWQYGFILRYPADKQEVTGIIYEPWHYRYVGQVAAKEITAAGICLEEWWAAEQSIQ